MNERDIKDEIKMLETYLVEAHYKRNHKEAAKIHLKIAKLLEQLPH